VEGVRKWIWSLEAAGSRWGGRVRWSFQSRAKRNGCEGRKTIENGKLIKLTLKIYD